MSKPPLSVCIITYNEIANIEDCLDSVAWADEIVVLDSGSDDGTVEAIERRGHTVIHQDFLGHVKQKELTIRKATHRWVLCLDADERLQEGGEVEVRAFLEAPGDTVGCFFPRHTFYLGGWIDHGGWWPEWRLRLFDRERGRWTGTDPHDRVEVDGPTRRLKSELIHFNYRDLSHHLEKVNSYTTIMADRRFEKGEKPSLIKLIFNPIVRFLRMYIFRRGFLDGRRGFVIAVIGAFYVFLKYAKLWEKNSVRHHFQDENGV